MVSGMCRVCGFKYKDFFPWGIDGATPSHEICDCCGTEFGYEDNTPESTDINRKRWIDNGAEWFSPEKRPVAWLLEEQLKKL